MTLKEIYNKVINEGNGFKNLYKNYPSHKIPVDKIFKNKNAYDNNPDKYNLMNKLDVYTSDSDFEKNPIEVISIDRIIPTQRTVSKDNLLSVKDVLDEDNTGAYLVKYNDFYYVMDGHHRISMKILDGETMIKAYVQEI